MLVLRGCITSNYPPDSTSLTFAAELSSKWLPANMSSDKSGRFGKPVRVTRENRWMLKVFFFKKMETNLELDQVCLLWSMKPVKFLVAAMKTSKTEIISKITITTAGHRPAFEGGSAQVVLWEIQRREANWAWQKMAGFRPWGLWGLDPNQWGISDISHRKSLPVIFGILYRCCK